MAWPNILRDRRFDVSFCRRGYPWCPWSLRLPGCLRWVALGDAGAVPPMDIECIQAQRGCQKEQGNRRRAAAQERGRSSRTEYAGRGPSTEGSACLGTTPLLHEHERDQDHAGNHMKNDQSCLEHCLTRFLARLRHNFQKAFSLQGGATNQQTIHRFDGQELLGIAQVHAAAIQHRQILVVPQASQLFS